jgi:hypothetical protein
MARGAIASFHGLLCSHRVDALGGSLRGCAFDAGRSRAAFSFSHWFR